MPAYVGKDGLIQVREERNWPLEIWVHYRGDVGKWHEVAYFMAEHRASYFSDLDGSTVYAVPICGCTWLAVRWLRFMTSVQDMAEVQRRSEGQPICKRCSLAFYNRQNSKPKRNRA